MSKLRFHHIADGAGTALRAVWDRATGTYRYKKRDMKVPDLENAVMAGMGFGLVAGLIGGTVAGLLTLPSYAQQMAPLVGLLSGIGAILPGAFVGTQCKSLYDASKHDEKIELLANKHKKPAALPDHRMS